jgi:hypothetical protein
MIKSISSKKAQEMSITTIVVLVLAILVLVVVAFGFWKGWDYVFGKMGLLPNDLNSAAAICAQYDDSELLLISYCQYRQLTIDDKKQLVNCPYVYERAEAGLGAGKAGFDLKTCSINATAYCAQLKAQTGFKDTVVNGADCKK